MIRLLLAVQRDQSDWNVVKDFDLSLVQLIKVVDDCRWSTVRALASN